MQGDRRMRINTIIFPNSSEDEIGAFTHEGLTIGSLSCLEHYAMFKGMQNWKSIPDFSIITGVNGSGKSQLLQYISGNLLYLNKYLYFMSGEFNHSHDFLAENKDEFFKQTLKDIKKIYQGDNNLEDSVYRLNSLKNSNVDLFWNIIFKGFSELSDDYKRSLKCPKEEINLLLQEENFPYYIHLLNSESWGFVKKSDEYYSNDAFYGVVEKGDLKVLNFAELSHGEKLVFSVLTWMFKFDEQMQFSNNVKIMLLDEPDKHLDPKSSKIFMDIVSDILVGKYGIQVIMTTHRIDTIAQDACKNVFMIREARDGSKSIVQVPKLAAMFRMSRNFRGFIDYSHRVYTESSDDARFYQGVYGTLKDWSDKARERKELNSQNDPGWEIKGVGRYRLLSDRYQLTFHSVSEIKDANGGCEVVLKSVRNNKNAIRNLFLGNTALNSSEISIYWKKNKKILDLPNYYEPFGVLDYDYGKDYKLAHMDEGNNFIITKRHSLENYVLDPVILCLVLDKNEISQVMTTSEYHKDENVKKVLLGLCENIKNSLIKKNFDNTLQNNLNQYFKLMHIKILEVWNKMSPEGKNNPKLGNKEFYEMMGKVNFKNKDMPFDEVAEMKYLDADGEVFSIKYPKIFLDIRGHDIEERFFGKKNKGKPTKKIVDKIFNNGLPVIPLDLAEMFFDLNMKVRTKVREALKPEIPDPFVKIDKRVLSEMPAEKNAEVGRGL